MSPESMQRLKLSLSFAFLAACAPPQGSGPTTPARAASAADQQNQVHSTQPPAAEPGIPLAPQVPPPTQPSPPANPTPASPR
jgi:hypothetical protein